MRPGSTNCQLRYHLTIIMPELNPDIYTVAWISPLETEAQAAYDTCQIFQGDRSTCGRVALGLSNCCNTPRGVSLYDYLMLAFSVSRLNANLTSLGFETPITSAATTVSMPTILATFEFCGREKTCSTGPLCSIRPPSMTTT